MIISVDTEVTKNDGRSWVEMKLVIQQFRSSSNEKEHPRGLAGNNHTQRWQTVCISRWCGSAGAGAFHSRGLPALPPGYEEWGTRDERNTSFYLRGLQWDSSSGRSQVDVLRKETQNTSGAEAGRIEEPCKWRSITGYKVLRSRLGWVGVQSSAGTKGNTYMTFDVVDPYGSSMAEGKWLRSHGFQCLACCFGGCSYFTLPWVEWAKSWWPQGSSFLGTDTALRRRQGKESVVQGRQECMHDFRSTQRSMSNAGGIRSEMWVGSVARIRGVYDAPGIY